MIDFDEELKHFSPSLEVSQADEDIFKNDLKDITDIVLQMTEDLRNSGSGTVPKEESDDQTEEDTSSMPPVSGKAVPVKLELGGRQKGKGRG